MAHIIRLNANLQAPDFTKIKPPFNIEDYQIDCSKFQSRQLLEDKIQQRFSQIGVVILINTELHDLSKLNDWGRILINEPMSYQGGTGSRPQFGKNIYDVVANEPHYTYIYPHNEMSYLSRFPQCIVLACETIPSRGGETLIFDNQAVTHEILQTEIGQKLKKNGVRYIRNLTDASKANDIVYNHWQDAFNVSSKEEIENIAQQEGWDLVWTKNGGVQISYKREAYEYNETLKENLLFVNLSFLSFYFDDWHPFNTLLHEERPFHVVHGDGTLFTEQETEYLVKIFNKYCLPIFWKSGWIAMFDNKRWTHARPPFTLQKGESRKLGAMIGKPKNRLGARF